MQKREVLPVAQTFTAAEKSQLRSNMGMDSFVKDASVSGSTLTLTKQDDTTVTFTGGGGGGAPDEYLKTASVSGSTLTLTKQDDTTVTFTGGGGGGGGTVDQTYSPTSANAQSGTAVAESFDAVSAVRLAVSNPEKAIAGDVSWMEAPVLNDAVLGYYGREEGSVPTSYMLGNASLTDGMISEAGEAIYIDNGMHYLIGAYMSAMGDWITSFSIDSLLYTYPTTETYAPMHYSLLSGQAFSLSKGVWDGAKFLTVDTDGNVIENTAGTDTFVNYAYDDTTGSSTVYMAVAADGWKMHDVTTSITVESSFFPMFIVKPYNYIVSASPSITALSGSFEALAVTLNESGQVSLCNVSVTNSTECTVTGTNSIAFGQENTVTSDNSIAFGQENTASGACSVAEGMRTSATGYASHAEGDSTQATDQEAHAEGSGTKATRACTHAEGSLTEASNVYAHAEGNKTKATGSSSHAEGKSTTASGDSSHAEGLSSVASGIYSHAEGCKTTAASLYAHAEGDANSVAATADAAHAEGMENTATGKYSHVEGKCMESYDEASHAGGKYGVLQTSGAEVIGGGTNMVDRKNIRVLDWSGNETIAGTLTCTGVQVTGNTGTAAPTSTPSYVGQVYLDTANRKMYVAFGTSGSSDWVAIN